jgi:hypothetical protein
MVETAPQAFNHAELPPELRATFAQTGPGCIATETNLGVVHVCHASEQDIAGFTDQPVWYRWELARLPTAPIIRLNLAILDQPQNPYRYESFLNIGDDDQARILARLVSQEQLILPFYGDDLSYRFTKTVPHQVEQRTQLGGLVAQAVTHWQAIPAAHRDFDRAKATFQRQYPL